MLKKIIIFILIALIFLTAYSIWSGFKFKERSKQQRQAAKAEEIKITIKEGWNNQEIMNYLENAGLARKTDFIKALNQVNLIDFPIINLNNNKNLEGFLFPDTYNIYKPKENFSSTTAEIIIKKMLTNFELKFSGSMQEQARSQKMSIYEIVILASIIEKEAGGKNLTADKLDEQRKIISGVFYNRLKINMPLQSDATITYITKKQNAASELADTKIDSPYNSYKYSGLPLGPICNPSLSSIMAALHPTATNYLYFLHKQPSGDIVYAKTYEEHLINKQKYLR